MFNSELFQIELEKATKEAYTKLLNLHKKDEFCGFALYSDESAMSIAAAANTISHLKCKTAEDPDDPIYYKWSPAEWAFEAFGDQYFEIPRKMLVGATRLLSGDSFIRLRNLIYETALITLVNLKDQNFFTDYNDFVLLFTVSEYDNPAEEINWANRLNNPELAKEFGDWLKSL